MSCLFKQCLHSGPNGYFSTICWLGTKSAGLPSHLHQEWQCFPRKHGRRLTQRGPSLCKHVQTCKHRPSSSLYVAWVSQGGETLKFLPCQFAVADKSQEIGWDVGGGGWVGGWGEEDGFTVLTSRGSCWRHCWLILSDSWEACLQLM